MQGRLESFGGGAGFFAPALLRRFNFLTALGTLVCGISLGAFGELGAEGVACVDATTEFWLIEQLTVSEDLFQAPRRFYPFG